MEKENSLYSNEEIPLPALVYEGGLTIESFWYDRGMNANEKQQTPRLHNIKEVAQMWNLSVWEVRRLINQGKVRPILGFKAFKFTGDELDVSKLERL